MDGINLLRALVHLSVLVIICVMLLLITGLHYEGTSANETATPLSSATLIELSVDATVGKALFKQHCGQCHHRNMIDPLVGPPLRGAEERWAAYPPEDLINWVKNSGLLIEQQHPKALQLWNDWRKSTMPAFPMLSEAEIRQIFRYAAER